MKTAEALQELIWLHRSSTPAANPYLESDPLSSLNRLSLIGPGQKSEMLKALFEVSERAQSNIAFSFASSELMDITRRLVSAFLFQGATHRYELNPPKVHHWIPVCYLKNFSRGFRGERQARIPSTQQAKRGKRQLVTFSTQKFAHKERRGQGFYPLAAEKFFSLVENAYVLGLRKLENGKQVGPLELAGFVSLMAVQLLRAPASGTGLFKRRSFEELTSELMEILDRLETAQAFLVSSEAPLVFSARRPVVTHRFFDGAEGFVFPLSSKLGLVLGTRELSTEESERALLSSQRALRRSAARSGELLYGELPEDKRLS